MFQVGGDSWKAWNGALKPALVDSQVREGEDRGLWRFPPASGIGRARGTALATLTLEVYYRYSKVFK